MINGNSTPEQKLVIFQTEIDSLRNLPELETELGYAQTDAEYDYICEKIQERLIELDIQKDAQVAYYSQVEVF